MEKTKRRNWEVLVVQTQEKITYLNNNHNIDMRYSRTEGEYLVPGNPRDFIDFYSDSGIPSVVGFFTRIRI